MRLINTRYLRLILFALLLTLSTAMMANAQSAKLQLNGLDRLEALAEQTVDVTVDQKVLQLALPFLSARKPKEAQIRDLIKELQGVFVKHFTFEKPGQYTLADIEGIRSQLNGPGWSKMANVRTKRNGQNIDAFTMIEGSKIVGLAVIITSDTELTIVNVVGPIDLEKLSALEGSFGIPDLEIERDNKTQKE